MSPKRPKKGVSVPSRARGEPSEVRKPGRPTAYTHAIGERLCKLVAAGVPIGTACRMEGVGKQTLYDWRAAGKAARAPYAQFVRELDAALAKVEAGITIQLVAATKRDWRAAAWWLERRKPARYKLQQQIRIEKAAAEMTEAELDAAIAAHGYVRVSEGAPHGGSSDEG
jgi:hypothetical protein